MVVLNTVSSVFAFIHFPLIYALRVSSLLRPEDCLFRPMVHLPSRYVLSQGYLFHLSAGIRKTLQIQRK